MNALKTRQRATKDITDQNKDSALYTNSEWLTSNDEHLNLKTLESPLNMEEQGRDNYNSAQLCVDVGMNKETNSKHVKNNEQGIDLYFPEHADSQKVVNEDTLKDCDGESGIKEMNLVFSHEKFTDVLDYQQNHGILSPNKASRAIKCELISELQYLSTRLDRLQNPSGKHVTWISNINYKDNWEDRINIGESENNAQERQIVRVPSSTPSATSENLLLPCLSKISYDETFNSVNPITCDVTNSTSIIASAKEVLVGPSQICDTVSFVDCGSSVMDTLILRQNPTFSKISTIDQDADTNFRVNLPVVNANTSRNVYTALNVELFRPLNNSISEIGPTELYKTDECSKSAFLSIIPSRNFDNRNDEVVHNSCLISTMLILDMLTGFSPSNTVTSDTGNIPLIVPVVGFNNCFNNIHGEFHSISEILSIANLNENISDSSISLRSAHMTNGLAYNHRISPPLPGLVKKRLQTKKIRDQFRYAHCQSPKSDMSDDVMSSNKKLTNDVLSLKKRRTRSSPIGRLLKSYLHEASSSDVEIDGLELPRFVTGLGLTSSCRA